MLLMPHIIALATMLLSLIQWYRKKLKMEETMSQRYQTNISSVKQLKKSCKHKDKGFSLDARVLVLTGQVVEDRGP